MSIEIKFSGIDRGSIERGRAYASAGRVLAISVDSNKITGSVIGSSRKPYRTVVYFDSASRQPKVVDSQCSCPLGGYCKHAVALATQVFAQGGGQLPRVTWRKNLEQVTRRLPGAQEGGTGFSNTNAQLGVMLQAAIDEYMYRGPVIKIRLVGYLPKTGKLGAAFAWSKMRQSWELKELASQLPAMQWQWLEELLAAMTLSAYSSSGGYYESGNSAWRAIGEPSMGPVIRLLERAGAAGVSLWWGTQLNRSAPLTFDTRPVSVRMRLKQTGDSGYTLDETWCIGGDETAGQRVCAVWGDPPGIAIAYVAGNTNSAEYLYSRPVAVHPCEGGAPRLHEGPIDIPSSEIHDFVRDFAPALAKSTIILNQTGIELPERIGKPLLRLRASRGKNNTLHLKPQIGYGNALLQADDDNQAVKTESGTVLRNQAGEQALLSRLQNWLATFEPELGASAEPQAVSDTIRLTGLAAAKAAHALQGPTLPVEDMTSDIDASAKTFRQITSNPEVELNLDKPDGQRDWFDLYVTVKVGSEDVAFAELFAALARDEEFLLLPSGGFFSLKNPALQQLRQIIAEARSIQDPVNGEASITKYQIGLWEELVNLGVVSKQSEAWQHDVRGLLDMRQVPDVAPSTRLQAQLRPYQAEGLRWLYMLQQQGLGGILADDMGLGKTLQIIAMLDLIISKKTSPVLICAPRSVLENWVTELAKFAPHLRVLPVRTGSDFPVRSVPAGTVVVMSYAMAQRLGERLHKTDWQLLVCDEAQYLKNYQAKSHGLLKKLPAASKIALTGTPLENSVLDIWSVCAIVAPGLFAAPKHFNEHYRQPIEREGDTESLDRLRRRLKPFLLRRRKEEVATELPPKTEQVQWIELTSEQRKLYDLHLQKERQRILGLLGEADGFKRNRLMILRSLTRLRQLCLSPQLLPDEERRSDGIKPSKNDSAKAKTKSKSKSEQSDDPVAASSKLSYLVDQLGEVVAEGHRALVFSQFTQFLGLLKQALAERNIPFVYLDGSTRKRQEVLAEWKNGSAPLFLISLKAGGSGLNLTEADYCFLLDPWWNPAVEAQAVDRTHRIGQDKPVMVYRLIAKDTIEEKVLALQQRKRQLAGSLLDGAGSKGFADLVNEDDIKALLE